MCIAFDWYATARLEHAVERFRLLDSGVPGDLAGLTNFQRAVLPAPPPSR